MTDRAYGRILPLSGSPVDLYTEDNISATPGLAACGFLSRRAGQSFHFLLLVACSMLLPGQVGRAEGVHAGIPLPGVQELTGWLISKKSCNRPVFQGILEREQIEKGGDPASTEVMKR